MRNNEQLYLVITIKLYSLVYQKKPDTLKNNYSFGHTYN